MCQRFSQQAVDGLLNEVLAGCPRSSARSLLATGIPDPGSPPCPESTKVVILAGIARPWDPAGTERVDGVFSTEGCKSWWSQKLAECGSAQEVVQALQDKRLAIVQASPIALQRQTDSHMWKSVSDRRRKTDSHTWKSVDDRLRRVALNTGWQAEHDQVLPVLEEMAKTKNVLFVQLAGLPYWRPAKFWELAAQQGKLLERCNSKYGGSLIRAYGNQGVETIMAALEWQHGLCQSQGQHQHTSGLNSSDAEADATQLGGSSLTAAAAGGGDSGASGGHLIDGSPADGSRDTKPVRGITVGALNTALPHPQPAAAAAAESGDDDDVPLQCKRRKSSMHMLPSTLPHQASQQSQQGGQAGQQQQQWQAVQGVQQQQQQLSGAITHEGHQQGTQAAQAATAQDRLNPGLTAAAQRSRKQPRPRWLEQVDPEAQELQPNGPRPAQAGQTTGEGCPAAAAAAAAPAPAAAAPAPAPAAPLTPAIAEGAARGPAGDSSGTDTGVCRAGAAAGGLGGMQLLQALKTSVTRQQQQLQSLQAEKRKLHDQLSSGRQQWQELQNQVQKQQQKAVQEQHQHKLAVQQLQSEKQELQDQLSRRQLDLQTVQQLQAEKAQLLRTVDELQQQLQAYESIARQIVAQQV